MYSTLATSSGGACLLRLLLICIVFELFSSLHSLYPILTLKMLSSPRPAKMSLSGSMRPYKPSRMTLRDATIDDARILNSLVNEVIREETKLDWEVERPLSERERYLELMISTAYPCLLAFEDGELIAFGALEQWDVDAGTPEAACH